MNIIISNANNQPIYEQIYIQIKTLILSRKLKEEEQLPSIRNLAKDLRISVITTKRAYEELKNTEFIRESHLKEIEEYIRKINQLAAECNLTTNDIIEMIKMISEEN